MKWHSLGGFLSVNIRQGNLFPFGAKIAAFVRLAGFLIFERLIRLLKYPRVSARLNASCLAAAGRACQYHFVIILFAGSNNLSVWAKKSWSGRLLHTLSEASPSLPTPLGCKGSELPEARRHNSPRRRSFAAARDFHRPRGPKGRRPPLRRQFAGGFAGSNVAGAQGCCRDRDKTGRPRLRRHS